MAEYTKDEFIKLCKLSGYCTTKVAKKYCEDKDVLSEKDFEEVYRISENFIHNSPYVREYQGAKSSKHLQYSERHI